jgi:hypothetical protein
MTSNPQFYDTTVETALNAGVALLNNGFLEIWSGSQPSLDGSLTGTKLAKLGFGATAFAGSTATGGTVTATANAISSGVALATGTAGYFALLKSDDATVVATGAVGLSGSDLNMSSLSVVAGQIVAASSFSVTQPQT